MIADRILLSEAVFTGNTLEPFAGGVAIAGNRVLAAGSKDEVTGAGRLRYPRGGPTARA